MILIIMPFLILGSIYFSILVIGISEIATYELLKFRKKLPKFIKFLTHIFVGLIVGHNLINISIEVIFSLSILYFALSMS